MSMGAALECGPPRRAAAFAQAGLLGCVVGPKGARPWGRPLIVAMSFQPAIPQRVARQQSPPPLHRLGSIVKLEGADVKCHISRVKD